MLRASFMSRLTIYGYKGDIFAILSMSNSYAASLDGVIIEFRVKIQELNVNRVLDEDCCPSISVISL